MTPEAQRIAIAEACGWTEIRMCSCKIIPRGKFKIDGVIRDEHLPDYLNDLNAMHAAENSLDQKQRHRFPAELAGAVSPDSMTRFDLCHATAAQRAEAFLRTIGKWDETK